MEALKPFRVKGPKQNPAPMEYLQTRGAQNYDIELEVAIQPEKGPERWLAAPISNTLYWSMAQQLAHHVNGCNVQVGDLMASGTISDPRARRLARCSNSLGGQNPIPMADGSTRTFLLDGDRVTVRAGRQKTVCGLVLEPSRVRY